MGVKSRNKGFYQESLNYFNKAIELCPLQENAYNKKGK
jgi:hypothetical protein